jgi:hypothetical protein
MRQFGKSDCPTPLSAKGCLEIKLTIFCKNESGIGRIVYTLGRLLVGMQLPSALI